MASVPSLRRLGRAAGLLAVAMAAVLCGHMPALSRDGPEEVDVELVLAVDVSWSMDPEEQTLQRIGYMEALRSPEILAAIRKGVNGRIAVTYFEWAGSISQDIIVPWHIIDGPETAEAFVSRLANRPTRRLYRTSISGAIDFAVPLFEGNGYHGLKQVIDISGDGANNQGRPVTVSRDDAVAKGITINGLPVMLNRPNAGYAEVEHLDEYYSDCVIGGPGAFMIPIRDRSQFVDATRTKILLEIALVAPPELPPRVVPAQFNPAQAQAQKPRSDCMFGERSWQQRWGN
ncbi:MAG: DUF1194 domain-containing protein [Burkholderiales bacterium]|nr:DUF1194 domain-containing protein [Burkholderiales bacterium]